MCIPAAVAAALAIVASAGAASAQEGTDVPQAARIEAATPGPATSEANVIVGASSLGTCFRRAPVYPPDALRAEMSGRSLVSFVIRADGRPDSPKLHRSSGYSLLDEAALRHLEGCLTSFVYDESEVLPSGLFILPLSWRIE
jgi:TonB family protein